MKWNCRLRGLTLFVFNFGVESLELSVKLVRFPWQLPSLNATFFQTDNQKSVLFTVFSSLELFFSCCTVFEVAKENLLQTAAIVLLANFQRIQMLRYPRLTLDWLSENFFDY